ncbi:elongation factor P maturation arginine rhamnosyltransferase EarP [Piscinibacter sakaiensis]|uniref:elongation factor P maturation arginine rhamnosyltransferase EarP n=1 Tax=Piscinibacter sakaiensis TaxID=1547922 RepID=UPI00372A321F
MDGARDPPAAFLAALARAALQARADGRSAPAWINLEYLSAEDHAERSHRLPSPQWHGPAAGLVKHFFFPGFTPASGGLLREAGLAAWQDHFDADAWRAAHGLAPGCRSRTTTACSPPAT